MRMRKLGQGQCVMFLASDEVAALIAETTGCDPAQITSKEVLIWSIKETWRQLQANLPAYVVQGHSFARREAAWNSLRDGQMSHQNLAEILCEKESRTLRELYGPSSGSELSWIHEYHSPKAPSEISQAIYQRCSAFRIFSISDANIDEEKEVELVHEKEVERVLERPQPAKAVPHAINKQVIAFVNTGSIPSNSRVFHKIDSALLHTSIPIPKGLQSAFPNLFATEDFCRTIEVSPLPSSSSSLLKGVMDDFLRPVEWLVIPNTLHPSYAVAFSPFEVNGLFEEITASLSTRLYPFAARTTLSMRSFDAFDSFTLPSQTTKSFIPPRIIRQINIFSGSIFIQDYRTYQDLCRVLKLHFDKVKTNTADPPFTRDIIDSTFFVIDPVTRTRLNMGKTGFQESPVPFLRKLLTVRRHGQGLGPSHMGKMLRGVKLKEEDFSNDPSIE
jgi:hypothetical protein